MIKDNATFFFNEKTEKWLSDNGFVINNQAQVANRKKGTAADRHSWSSAGTFYNFNISNIDEKSSKKAKYSISSDTKGRTLSELQQKYFKDSKVVDKDGNLKVMYRGGNEDINVFDRKKSKASNLYGRGFYFTDSEVERYSKNGASFNILILLLLKVGKDWLKEKFLNMIKR